MIGADPVDGPFDLAAIRCVAATSLRVIGTMHFGHISVFVLYNAGALHEIGPAQPDFLTRRQPEKLWRRNFAEIVLLDIEDAREGNLSRAGAGIFRIVHRIQSLHPLFRIIVNDQLQWIKHGHAARGALVQILPKRVLQPLNVNHAVELGHSNITGK